VTLRLLEPGDWALLPQHRDDITPENVETFNQARVSGQLKESVLDRLDFFLYMSEKEVAALAFPGLDGKLDYAGFSSRDERFHKWCRDLFDTTGRARALEWSSLSSDAGGTAPFTC
jgi:predicted transcriptional regulator